MMGPCEPEGSLVLIDALVLWTFSRRDVTVVGDRTAPVALIGERLDDRAVSLLSQENRRFRTRQTRTCRPATFDENQPSARSEELAPGAEGGSRLRKGPQDVTAEDGVVRGCGQPWTRGSAFGESEAGIALRLRPGDGEHLLGEVDPVHPVSELRRQDGETSGPAAQVDESRRRGREEPCQEISPRGADIRIDRAPTTNTTQSARV